VKTVLPRNSNGISKNPAGILIPAVICALLCVFFNQSGAFFIISLLPIGLAALIFSPQTCWVSVSYSILMYAASLFLFPRHNAFSLIDILLQTGIFSLPPVLFAWIIVPPQKGPVFVRMRTAFRFVMSSCIVLGIYIPLVYNLFQQEAFYQSFMADIEYALAIIPFAENSSDVVEQALLRDFFTPENIIDNIVFFGIRGGALCSIMIFFFLNRQASFSIARIFRRKQIVPSGLILFKVKSSFIWVLSLSILALLVSLQFDFEIPEIIAWNIFVLCVIVYSAQGLGIVLFFLNRPSVSRKLRILLNVLFIMMIFRFSVMMFFIVVLTILGIL
jgi:hypothetical protein